MKTDIVCSYCGVSSRDLKCHCRGGKSYFDVKPQIFGKLKSLLIKYEDTINTTIAKCKKCVADLHAKDIICTNSECAFFYKEKESRKKMKDLKNDILTYKMSLLSLKKRTKIEDEQIKDIEDLCK